MFLVILVIAATFVGVLCLDWMQASVNYNKVATRKETIDFFMKRNGLKDKDNWKD